MTQAQIERAIELVEQAHLARHPHTGAGGLAVTQAQIERAIELERRLWRAIRAQGGV